LARLAEEHGDKRYADDVRSGKVASFQIPERINYYTAGNGTKDIESSYIGKHNDVPDDQFDVTELTKGIEIESEHTDDPNEAKNIAKDHLSEIPDYYSRLEAMEAEAKGK
jgi:hypothetical protein